MPGLPNGTRIYFCSQPVDFRKGFDGLSGIVESVFGMDVLGGHLFLFVNRRHDRIKALWWEPGGLTLWYKRLERGTFEIPPAREGQTHVTIDALTEAVLEAERTLEEVQSRRRRKRRKRQRGRSEKFPDHIPRYEKIVDLPDDEKAGKAFLGYLKNNWDALLLYTTDGRLPIDNNETENLMRQIATGRKNWLHIGSLAAGARSANLMTIISTAARNDLDVWSYLKDILDRILAGCTDWDSVRADIWKQQHPKAVRKYRVEERRDAIDRRRARRAHRRLLANKK